jgi:hypothetical protein
MIKSILTRNEKRNRKECRRTRNGGGKGWRRERGIAEEKGGVLGYYSKAFSVQSQCLWCIYYRRVHALLSALSALWTKIVRAIFAKSVSSAELHTCLHIYLVSSRSFAFAFAFVFAPYNLQEMRGEFRCPVIRPQADFLA